MGPARLSQANREDHGGSTVEGFCAHPPWLLHNWLDDSHMATSYLWGQVF